MIILSFLCTKSHERFVHCAQKHTRKQSKQENDYRRYKSQKVKLHYNLKRTRLEVNKTYKNLLA